MQNIFQNSLFVKESQAQNLSPDNSNFNKLNHIYNTGKTVYLYEGFNIEAFISSVKIYLHNTLKLDTNTQNYMDNFIGIRYNSPNSFAGKVSISTDFIILFLKIDNILYFDINLAETYNKKDDTQNNLSLTSLLNDAHKKEITIFIYETIYHNYLQKISDKKFDFDNIFIEETHLNERVFINNIIKDEQLLVKLNLSSLKLKEQTNPVHIFNSSFIITEKSIAVIGFNKQGECLLFENIDDDFKIKKKLTKNTIHYDNLIWQPKRTNSKLFNQLKGFQEYSETERIKKIAEYNYLNKSYNSSIRLISTAKKKEDNPINDFILLLIRVKKDKSTVKDFISEIELKQISQKLLTSDHAEKTILNTLKEWQIPYTEKTFFLELFVETADNSDKQKKIIPLYETIRTEFKKQNKDLIKQTVFDINYAEFLINSGKKRKAIKILKDLLKHLPDETISDVLPAEDLNLSGNKSGQLLKIKILNLLTFAKGKSQSDKEIQQLVQLQPLNTNIISQLSESKNDTLKNKANEIRGLMRESGLSIITKEIPVKKYKELPNSLLDSKLRHPATTKSGSFYSFQKWISKIKVDDYSSLKEYAEKIEADNYPKLYEIFENVQYIFNIEELEFYISRGEKSQGIIGYEGKPPFIIIGQKHLDKNSDLYLNFAELQFSVATELAHIYYKHSRISSNDVWRGVADKGSILLDALLGIVPVAGLAGKSIQNSQKLSRLTNIINSSNQITNGKNIFDTAIKLSNYYKSNTKTDSKTEKKQKLLAASRLMQYTADRVGLAVSGDIKSAIRTIFLTGKFNYAFFEEAEKTSLKEFILKVNNDGSYKHQDFTLRIAHLFSFYISEVYTEIREIITKED